MIPAILVMSLAAGESAMAATWYVAPGGSGSGSSGSPMGRIQDALSAAQPGDTVMVRAGTYTGAVKTVRHGRADAPILVRADSPGSAILTAVGEVLQVDHASIVFEGLVFDGQYGAADTLDINGGANALVLRGVEVRQSGRDCIDMTSPSNVLIEDSLIHHCLNTNGPGNDSHGVTAGAIHDLTIRRTEIHTFSGDAVQVDPGRTAPGWDRVTIEHCRFWLAPLDVSVNGFPVGKSPGENAIDTKTYAGASRARITFRGGEFWGFRNGLITNQAAFNLKEFIDATVDGVLVKDSDIAFRLRFPAVVRVQNSVVHDVGHGVRYEDNIESARLYNMTFGRGVTRMFTAASSGSAGLDVRNSIFLSANRPSEASAASNRAVGAAEFMDAAGHDYHLSATAGSIDAGEALAGVHADRDGVGRPQGPALDAGAYEFCAVGCGSARLPSAPRNVRFVP